MIRNSFYITILSEENHVLIVDFEIERPYQRSFIIYLWNMKSIILGVIIILRLDKIIQKVLILLNLRWNWEKEIT